jgi:uncharacterized protein YciI
MADWVYFIHAPRDNFVATMSTEEQQLFTEHFRHLAQLRTSGTLVLAGPTLGPVNTGIVIFEAPDEAAARRLMEQDPVIAGGLARGELRPFEIALLRGRD